MASFDISAVFPGDLEGKVKWLDNYQKVKQLRDALVWLPVWERDKRAFVPEVRLRKTDTLDQIGSSLKTKE